MRSTPSCPTASVRLGDAAAGQEAGRAAGVGPGRRGRAASNRGSREAAEAEGCRECLPLAPSRPLVRAKKRRLLVAAAAGVLAAAVITAVVIFWQTPQGTVRIESDDPTVEIVFDKTGPTIKGADKEPISLRPGAHGILVKRGSFTFETDKLAIHKGKTTTLQVQLLEGKIQVKADGRIIGDTTLPADEKKTEMLASSDPNRRAAEYVLSIGGRLEIKQATFCAMSRTSTSCPAAPSPLPAWF